MPHVTWNFEIDTVMTVAIFNVALTGLHYLLFKIHEKNKSSWSETALNAVNFLMTTIAIIGMNRPHPDTAKEVGDKK